MRMQTAKGKLMRWTGNKDPAGCWIRDHVSHGEKFCLNCKTLFTAIINSACNSNCLYIRERDRAHQVWSCDGWYDVTIRIARHGLLIKVNFLRNVGLFVKHSQTKLLTVQGLTVFCQSPENFCEIEINFGRLICWSKFQDSKCFRLWCGSSWLLSVRFSKLQEQKEDVKVYSFITKEAGISKGEA